MSVFRFKSIIQGVRYMTLSKPGVSAELVQACWILQLFSQQYKFKALIW
jgi:hypothetical protein